MKRIRLMRIQIEDSINGEMVDKSPEPKASEKRTNITSSEIVNHFAHCLLTNPDKFPNRPEQIMIEECAEAIQVLNKMMRKDYTIQEKSEKYYPQLVEEVTYVLFTLTAICEYYNIKIEDINKETIKKYLKYGIPIPNHLAYEEKEC